MDTFINIASSFFSETANVIGDIINSFAVDDKPKGHAASFAKEKSLLTDRDTGGFCLNGRKYISRDLTYRGAYIQAPSGAGKSTVILLPNIFTTQASMIVHDPSGELATKSLAQLQQREFNTIVFRPHDASTSCGFNPLARAKTKSEIRKVASLLIESTLGANQKSDPFWNSLAIDLLSMLIELLMTQPEQYRTLANVRHLLNHIHPANEN